ncbi:unnamed protein product [Paramecium octaurelia]|uniref:Uncharacterized protein n=1 Tax=Paramecium octaurelia TaxID=43137 RepID=A0A8S1XCX9_PAROT|nr:unnamed protein product [Paramecium octaurelia]
MSFGTPDKRTLEKQKKLLIKKIMGWIRQCFNDRQIGFHPFILCVSIKPSVNQRCATIQSYPNQELWKSLHSLQDQELLSQIIQEVSENTFKLKDKYDNSLIQQFLIRIKNNFDFCKFYKETQEQGFDQDEHASEFTELNYTNQKTKQFQKNESESKQLLKQIELCNTKQGSIISIEKQHYHKLFQLFEKICSVPEENYSTEMRKFRNQLSLLLESTQNPQEKQVCIKNDFQTEKVAMLIQNRETYGIEQYHLLQDIKQEVLSTMPEIVLFLPSEQNNQRIKKDELYKIEEEFFQELYFYKTIDAQVLTPYNITYFWKHYFQPKIEHVCSQWQQVKIE